jgi:hypothetical protein
MLKNYFVIFKRNWNTQGVSEIHGTNPGACCVNRNSEKFVFKHELLHSSSVSYGPLYFGWRRLKNKVFYLKITVPNVTDYCFDNNDLRKCSEY